MFLFTQVPKSIWLLGVLLIVSGLCLMSALFLGSAELAWQQVWSSLWDPRATLAHTIVVELRMPRAINAFTTGGLLGLAGLLLQALLANPLAEPYVLGVSGGAACGALLGMLLGVHVTMLPMVSLLGAAVAMYLVLVLANARGRLSREGLLLTGVVMAAGWGALISLLLILSPSQQLPPMLFWLLGDVSIPHYLGLAVSVCVIGTVYAYLLAPQLDVYIYGERQAQVLGVASRSLFWQLFFLSSVLTAVAVSLAGGIGFVGLLVPHLMRLLHASGSYRYLVPATVLGGGSLLVLADNVAKSWVVTGQLPVGVITALVGVPVFLLLLLRRSS